MTAQGEPSFACRCTGGDKEEEIGEDLASVVHAIDLRDAGRHDSERAEDEDVGIDIRDRAFDDTLHDGGKVVADGLGECRERFCGVFRRFRRFRNWISCGKVFFERMKKLPRPSATPSQRGNWQADSVGFSDVKEGGDGDGNLAGRHLVTEAGKVLLRGCFRVIIGVKSGNPMEKSLSCSTKFLSESETDVAPVAIIGSDVDARPFDENGQGLDSISGGHGVVGKRCGHSRAGLM